MIDTKALRSKVLDLAVQGKLTEQLESDGTAEELYQQIQEEKQKLIKEGKIKKEKALQPIFNEEIPFEIPSNWRWCRFGEILNIVSAKRVHQSDWQTSGVPFYRAREISKLCENGYVNNDLYISEELYKEYSKFGIPKAGDLMISAVGTLGKSYIVKETDKFYYKDASVLCIENIGKISSVFLSYILKSEMMKKQIKSNSTGTTVDTLTMIKLIQYYIPLPPLAEQKRIVERVEEIFKYLDIIDEAQKKYSADAEILKNKLITMGIQGKLTKQLDSDGAAEELFEQIQNEKQKLIKEKKIPKEQKLPSISKEEISFNIPCNWKWVRVQDIATYITDYVANGSFATLKAHTKTYKEPNYALFVRTMDLSCNFSETCSYIDKESYDFLSKSQLFGGELILPNIGASIGKAFIMPNLNMPMSLAPNSILLKFTDTSMNKYFSYIVKSSFGQNLLTKSQGGSATAKFSKTDLRKLVVPLPPLAEQKRIADTLDEVLRVIG